MTYPENPRAPTVFDRSGRLARPGPSDDPSPMPDRSSGLRARAILGALAGALLGYGVLVEPRRLTVTRHDVERGGAPRDPTTPTSRLTLVQLADLHLGRLRPFHDRVVRAVHEARPDLILLTGDSVESPRGLEALDELLEALPEVPRFAVPGNWEYWGGVPLSRLGRVVERRGGTLLVNESVAIDVGPHRVRVRGVDDRVGGTPDLDAAFAETRGDAALDLLLDHCPRDRDDLVRRIPPDAWPDLVLSGHTHGGHVNLLGLQPCPPGSGRYVDGWYRDDGPATYVSRGLGTSVLPLRLGVPPELAVFDLTLS